MRTLFALLVLAFASLAAGARAQPHDAWTIRGGHNRASHTHGGAPASVGRVAIVIDGPPASTARLRVVRLRWLRGHCREEGYGEVREITPVEIVLDGGRPSPARDGATVRAGSHVVITFASVEAYQACDRFAVELTLEIGGRRTTSRVPYEVWRREPLRR